MVNPPRQKDGDPVIATLGKLNSVTIIEVFPTQPLASVTVTEIAPPISTIVVCSSEPLDHSYEEYDSVDKVV